MKKKPTKRKNVQDATLLNVRSAKKRISELETTVKGLITELGFVLHRITKLEQRNRRGK